MALIKCPECGREISDKALVCIGCGISMEAIQTMYRGYSEELIHYPTIARLHSQDIRKTEKKKISCTTCHIDYDENVYDSCPLCYTRKELTCIRNELNRVKLELNNTKHVCTIEQLSDTERIQSIEQPGNTERTQSIEQPGNAECTQSIEQFHYGMKKAWNQDRKIQLKKGDVMNFGMYNGIPIEWIVLEKRADDLLLLSRNVLDYIKFNDTIDTRSYRQNIWEKSSLCRYLNGEFIEKSFSKEETDRILYGSDIDSSDEANTDKGLDDETFMGRVFCLSCREARDFFIDNRARIAFPLKSAVEKMDAMGQKKFIDKKIGSCSYWLRSRGYFGDYAAVVDSHGIIDDAGYNVGYMKIGIRPAMWIRQ